MSESLTRNFIIESIRAAEDGAGFWATLSTEFAVPREYGNEILIHNGSTVDLARSTLPLVVCHNTDDLNIGIVENLKIVGQKLKGLIRFGKSKRAKEILQDVKAGILINLSIGYQILESHFEGDDLVATKWAPHEVSIVSVPADPNAGIGRSKNSEKKLMNTEKTPAAGANSRSASNPSAIVQKERDRIRDITSIGSRRGMDVEAQEFIESGKSVQAFRNLALERLDDEESSPSPASHASVYMGRPGIDSSGFPEFSIKRALQALKDPRSVDAGYEFEVSQELTRKLGRKDGHLLVPIGYPNLQKRSMNVGTIGAGGAVVPSNLRPDLFIDALTVESAIMDLNITTFNETEGTLILPRAVSNPTANWNNLDDVDSIAESDAVLDQISFSPKQLTSMTTLSHKLIMQSSPDAEAMIQGMLAESIAEELDKQSVQGDGVGSKITGITNTTGIGSIEYANGGSPSWADIVNLEAQLTTNKIRFGNTAYLVHPLMAATLKTTEVAANTGVFILKDGMMNGHRVQVSTNVPATTVVFGAWSEFVLATWGILALDVNPYGATDFAKGNVKVRAILDLDVGVRRPGAFATLTEAVA